VAVTVDAVATNVTPDTATERAYDTSVTLTFQADATHIGASAGGRPLPVTVVETTKEYVAAEISFGAQFFYRESYPFQITFQLRDAGGAVDRETRVGQTFAAFDVWAFGSADATDASVEVAWPPGYNVDAVGSDLRRLPSADGPRLVASAIADPTTFGAYVSGEKSGTRARLPLEVPMSSSTAPILLLAWADDPEWLDRQADILTRGLPVLESTIGVDYPIEGTLSVSEHASQHLGDYAGLFNPAAVTILMRYDADPFTALHEAAHVWFNGSLFVDRWIGEAFASYYAERVGSELGLEMLLFELTPDLTAHAFALNEWDDPTFENLNREDFAYAATPEVAVAIADLAGDAGLQAVWRAAADDRPAYANGEDDALASDEPEPIGWQYLLDLLENETGADYDPIWTEWIIADADAGLLADREAARARYDGAVTSAVGWSLPRSTRLLMGAWDFPGAEEEIDQVHGILEDRATLDELAAQLDLDPTDSLRLAFEDEGIDAATEEIAEQTTALEAIDRAGDRLDRGASAVEQIGLLGEGGPAEALVDAREAYEAGDDVAAVSLARTAIERQDAATDRGRLRAALVGGGILSLDLLAMAGLAVRGRRRRMRERSEVSAA